MVEPYSAKKAKKALFFKLSMGAASLAVLTLPLAAHAGAFSFFSSFFNKSATPALADTTNLNSQTLPLLQPAVNLDPNPAIGGGDIAMVDSVALVPADSPAGTPADTEASSKFSQISVYTVRPGDTLSEIAEMFGVTVGTIAGANDIQARVIRPGQELVILPITGVHHTVAKGETLASIVKKYSGDLEETANYNELATTASLQAGQVVIVPDGVIAAVAPTKKPSSGSGTSSPTPASSAGFVNPLPGSVKTQGIHGYNGVDLGGARVGSPVLAAAAGSVIVAKSSGWNGGYGSYVVIQHGKGVQTLYAHLSSVSIGVGQSVDAGTTIGGVGNTGRSTGIHLHFEVRGASNPFAR